MTRKEAIMILENNRPSCGERIIFKESEVYEAMGMAIEALSAEPCEDAVSRQAAIDALRYAELGCELEAIEGLPSVQAQQTCEYWDSESKFCALCRPSAQPEHKKISNKEWVDFLSEQFAVSRTTAREMLHGLMKWKAEDNFKKQYSGGRNEKG